MPWPRVDESAASSKAERVYARYPRDFDGLGQRDLFEVFPMPSAINTKKLLVLGHIVPLGPADKVKTCSRCRKLFVEFAYEGHVRQHDQRSTPSQIVDAPTPPKAA